MLKAKMPFNRTYLRTSPQKGVGLTRNGDFSELNEEFIDYKKRVRNSSWRNFTGFLGIFWPVNYFKRLWTRFSRTSRDMSKLTHGHLFKYWVDHETWFCLVTELVLVTRKFNFCCYWLFQFIKVINILSTMKRVCCGLYGTENSL